jgi:hypothetical protein
VRARPFRAGLLASLVWLAAACGRLAAPAPPTDAGATGSAPAGVASPEASPSGSPTPSAHILPEGRLPVAGPPDRFPFVCPTGQLLPRTDTPQEVREAARRLLEATGAPEPDPRTVWELLDPSLQALFPSYEDFARQMRAAPYDATYDPGEAVVSYVGRGWAESPTPAGATIPLLGDLLEQLCGPAVAEQVTRSYWYVSLVYPETVGDCAGCGLGLYFVTRADGVKLWTLT